MERLQYKLLILSTPKVLIIIQAPPPSCILDTQCRLFSLITSVISDWEFTPIERSSVGVPVGGSSYPPVSDNTPPTPTLSNNATPFHLIWASGVNPPPCFLRITHANALGFVSGLSEYRIDIVVGCMDGIPVSDLATTPRSQLSHH